MKYGLIVTLASLVLLGLAAVAICSTSAERASDDDAVAGNTRAMFRLPKILEFAHFKWEFKKHYATRVEESARAKLFCARAFKAFISVVEYKFGRAKSYLSINELSDLTPDERYKMYGTKPIFLPKHAKNKGPSDLERLECGKQEKNKGFKKDAAKPAVKDRILDIDTIDRFSKLPSQLYEAAQKLFSKPKRQEEDNLVIDHRSCLPRVRSQHSCGSCYIIAVVSLYEWMYCKAIGKRVTFSEQYAIDCGHRGGLEGCRGGFQSSVERFLVTFGLELFLDYPCRGAIKECPVSDDLSAQFMGNFRASPLNLQQIGQHELEAALHKAPIAVVMAASASFEDYGGGVAESDCLDKKYFHSMLLVGMGTQDGEEYWLMRNSWGSRWGENGYYKLNKQTKCLDVENNFPSILDSNANFKQHFTKNPLYLESLFSGKKARNKMMAHMLCGGGQ